VSGWLTGLSGSLDKCVAMFFSIINHKHRNQKAAAYPSGGLLF
jgi:hypothetical protein